MKRLENQMDKSDRYMQDGLIKSEEIIKKKIKKETRIPK